MPDPLKAAICSFFQQEQVEARRVFHGRGQFHTGFEHICLDWYAPVLLITAYDPISNVDHLLANIEAADCHTQVKGIVLQKRYESGAPAEMLKGVMPVKILAREDQLLFEVRPGKQQNSGLFLDMRPLRNWVKSNSKDKNVLNLFAYTCSFSVAALAGGASAVTNVDISKSSISWGLENHRHNQQDCGLVNQIPYNVFTSWGRIRQFGRYDLVIIDPPTRQRRGFDVEKNYGAVIRKLAKLCHDKAEIIATLNSPFLGQQFLLDKFAQYAPTAEFVESIPAAEEFKDRFPDRALKILRFNYKAHR
ncbi:MAG: class I SAM-dependent methyltransferase [Gammaproteobacteria bacterium]|nr:class I SAM-dependent methyltransferase [Gammaproteobacteria bacterium]